MPYETVKPGYAYKDNIATANYSDNHVKLKGASTSLKIKNDSGTPLEFSLNRSADTDEVDGVVLANEELDLNDIDQGLSTVAVRGSGAFRFWAYY